jgi:hypothetical protein
MNRAQFVLLAAALFAVALVPVVTAYYGMGYTGDVETQGPTVGDAVEHTVESALGRAAGDPTANWSARNRTAERVRARLGDAFESLASSPKAGNITLRTAPERAARMAAESCPGGPARRFGNCTAHGGVVLQNRTGRTAVVGAAVRVTWVGTERRGEVVLAVRYNESNPHSSARFSASSRARS